MCVFSELCHMPCSSVKPLQPGILATLIPTKQKNGFPVQWHSISNLCQILRQSLCPLFNLVWWVKTHCSVVTIDILSKVCPQWGEIVSYTCPLAQSVLLGRRMTWSSVTQDVPSVRIKGFTTEGENSGSWWGRCLLWFGPVCVQVCTFTCSASHPNWVYRPRNCSDGLLGECTVCWSESTTVQ